MRLRRAVGLIATLASCAAVAPPAAAAVDARLDGVFAMRGVITRAILIRGEHRGQVVTRRWTFSSQCASDPCDEVTLSRPRAGGSDTVTLHRVRRGSYAGSAVFYVPLLCDGALVPMGAEVPFTIGVRITRAREIGGTRVATSIRATYTNPRRINLTSCPGAVGHDTATYSGHRAP